MVKKGRKGKNMNQGEFDSGQQMAWIRGGKYAILFSWFFLVGHVVLMVAWCRRGYARVVIALGGPKELYEIKLIKQTDAYSAASTRWCALCVLFLRPLHHYASHR